MVSCRPIAASRNVANEGGRNDAHSNTEICHWEWDNEGVSFGAELPFYAHKENNETISSYRQDRQNPTKDPEP